MDINEKHLRIYRDLPKEAQKVLTARCLSEQIFVLEKVKDALYKQHAELKDLIDGLKQDLIRCYGEE